MGWSGLGEGWREGGLQETGRRWRALVARWEYFGGMRKCKRREYWGGFGRWVGRGSCGLGGAVGGRIRQRERK